MKTTSQLSDSETPNTPRALTRTRTKHTNSNISNQQREELINLILRTNSIRKSAQKMGINDSTAKSIYYKFKSTGMYSKTSKKRRNWKASNPTSSHGGDSKLAELKEGQVGHFDTNSEYVDRSSESKQSKTLI